MAEFRVPRILQRGLTLHRGMARAGGRPACRAGSGNPPALPGRSARRATRRAFAGWRNLARFSLVALALCLGAPAVQAQIISTRIWPAKDYTRVTVESKTEIKYQLFSVKNPERLVLDLEGVDFGPALAELNNQVATGDPYIDKLRVGRNRPGVVRVVL